MNRRLLVPMGALGLVWGVAGCFTATENVSPTASMGANVDPMMAEALTVRAPEGIPSVFSVALPVPFRVAVLQAAQFRRSHARWPVDRAELEREFGASSSQPYRLTTEPDGSLAVRWETAAGAGDVAVRLTADYVVSFGLTPAIDAAAAVRAAGTNQERRSRIMQTAVGDALIQIPKPK